MKIKITATDTNEATVILDVFLNKLFRVVPNLEDTETEIFTIK